MSNAKFGAKEVMDVVLYDMETDKPVIQFDSLKTSSISVKDDLFYVKNDEENVKLTWISAGLIKTYSVPSGGSKDDIVEDSVATSSAVMADMIGSF